MDIDYIYLLSQVFGFIAFIISIIAYQRNKKEKILKNMIVSDICNIIHYLLLGAYSGCLTKVIGLLRDSYIYKKEKRHFQNNLVLYILIVLYVIVGIITFKTIFSILPLLAALIYLIVIYNSKELSIKRVTLFCYFFWLIYNIYVQSVVGVSSNIISIIFCIIAIIRFKKGVKYEKN